MEPRLNISGFATVSHPCILKRLVAETSARRTPSAPLPIRHDHTLQRTDQTAPILTTISEHKI